MNAVSSFQFPVSSNGTAGARYEKLVAWQKAMELVRLCYALSLAFPADERFGLTAQLRRAAISIPSNIAEGQRRLSKGEFKQFLGHAEALCSRSRHRFTWLRRWASSPKNIASSSLSCRQKLHDS